MRNKKVKGGNEYMNMDREEIYELFSILHKWKTDGVSKETITLVNKEFDDPNNLRMFADAFEKKTTESLLYEESPDQDLGYTKKILAAGIKPTLNDIRASIANSDGFYKTAKLLLDAAKGTPTKIDINSMSFSSDGNSPQQYLMRWFFDAESPSPIDEEKMGKLLKLLLDHGLDVNKKVETYLTGYYANNDKFNNNKFNNIPISLIKFINDAANDEENPNRECNIKARDIIKEFLDETGKKEKKKEEKKEEKKEKEKVSVPSSKKPEGSKAATERAAKESSRAKVAVSPPKQNQKPPLPLVPGAHANAKRRLAVLARQIVPQSRTYKQWVDDFVNPKPSTGASLAEHWVTDFTYTQPPTYQWKAEFPELNSDHTLNNIMDHMININPDATKSILEAVLNISKDKSTLDKWVKEYTAHPPKGLDLRSRFLNAFRNVLNVTPNSQELTKLLINGIYRASIAAHNNNYRPVQNLNQQYVDEPIPMPAIAHQPIPALLQQRGRFTLPPPNPTRSNPPQQMVRMGGKILNPKTKRYVNAEGKVGKSMNNNKK